MKSLRQLYNSKHQLQLLHLQKGVDALISAHPRIPYLNLSLYLPSDVFRSRHKIANNLKVVNFHCALDICQSFLRLNAGFCGTFFEDLINYLRLSFKLGSVLSQWLQKLFQNFKQKLLNLNIFDLP